MPITGAEMAERMTRFFGDQPLNCLDVTSWLLTVADELGSLECKMESPDGLSFFTGDQLLCLVPTDRAVSKLRAILARLAYMCKQSGQDVSPYGGESTLMYSANAQPNMHFKLRFTNTPDCQEFHLTKVSS